MVRAEALAASVTLRIVRGLSSPFGDPISPRMFFTKLVLLVVFVAVAAYAKSKEGPAKGAPKLVKITLAETRPTQSVVGMEEVHIRRQLIEKAANGGKAALTAYLRENPGSVIRGPFGQLYLIDGHHFARALEDAGIEEMYVAIEKDWSHKKPTEFWEKMIQKERVYLKKFGKDLKSQAELPEHIAQLEDDPYRSLAWLLKKRGAYENLDMPFQEFIYADYLRDKVEIDFSTPDAVEKTVREGERAIKKAKFLPGSIKGREGGIPKCQMQEIFRQFAR